MKLSEAIQLRSASLRRAKKSERTIEWYEMWLHDLRRSLLLDDLGLVTLDDLRRWMDGLVARGLSDHSLRGAVTTTHIFFRWCIAEGYRSDDPSPRLEKPKKPELIPHALDTDEVLALLNAAARSRNPQRDVALVVFLTETGLRRGELVKLTVEDVKFSAQAGSGGWVIVRCGKGKKDRFTPFGEATRQTLSEWLAVRSSDLPTLFGIGYEGLPQLLLRLRRRAGVKSHCNPHAFRHSAATLRVEASAEASDLQQYFGWSDIRQAESYTKMARERLQRRALATSPMDRLLSGRLTPSK
jgi:integrase/recombinase XerD